MSFITLKSVTKVYPDKGGPGVVAVRAINLDVREREFMVLVGPSGCGKSTTLRMIAGLEDITSGTISIDGRIVNDVHPKDRDIAMVFQNYALYPHMSVFDNMAFGLKLRKLPADEIETRVNDAAAMLGLTDYLTRKPKALSGGQRQRVAVGRAIVRKPKVFLFDEPLSNLDAKSRVSMRSEIARLHDRLGATMVYVTHDQIEAMTMGDRVCVMKDGDIMQVDAPMEIYNHPANLFTAGFIGTPSMNLFHGSIKRTGDAAHFVTGGIDLALPQALAASAKAHGEKPVVLGVRPEDMDVANGQTSFSANVDLAEPLGAETILHLSVGPHAFTCRAAPNVHAPMGSTIPVTLNLDRAHLFDPTTSKVLG